MKSTFTSQKHKDGSKMAQIQNQNFGVTKKHNFLQQNAFWDTSLVLQRFPCGEFFRELVLLKRFFSFYKQF